MNPSAVLALPLLAALLWLLSRRRPQLSVPATVDAAPSPASVALLSTQSGAAAARIEVPVSSGPSAATPVRGRQQRLNALARQLSAQRDQRLDAVQQLAHWGDRAAVPLLRRGLRDPHPEVVRASVAALERFRGRSAAAPTLQTPARSLRLPRNAGPRNP